MGGGITRRFRPWTHTSDDSYICQLSLVVATATVSFLPLCVCALTSVCRTPPTRNRFRRKHGCRGPSFCPRFTSARVQNLYEFVELGCDVCYICTGEVQVGPGFSGWYQLVPRTIYVRDNRVCRRTGGCGWCCCRSGNMNKYPVTYVCIAYVLGMAYLGVVVVTVVN